MTKDLVMMFPEELPQGCPLPAAQDCSGSIYMISENIPVQESNFQSQAERGRALAATGDAACTRHGLSVFPTYESCAHHKLLFPRLGEHIVSAKLEPSHGKLMKTPSRSNPAHMTWWPYKGVTRSALFSPVES